MKNTMKIILELKRDLTPLRKDDLQWLDNDLKDLQFMLSEGHKPTIFFPSINGDGWEFDITKMEIERETVISRRGEDE